LRRKFGAETRYDFGSGVTSGFVQAEYIKATEQAVDKDGYYTSKGALIEALSDKNVQNAIALSAYTTTIATVIALLFAIPTGYALARWNFRGSWLIDALLIVPVIMAPMSLGVALLLMFRTGQANGLKITSCVLFLNCPA